MKATTSEISPFELEILQAFDVVIESHEWKINEEGFADVNQIAQVVANGELRKDCWVRHVAAATGLDLERLGPEKVLDTWWRLVSWPEREKIVNGDPYDSEKAWRLEAKIRGRLVSMRRRGLVWRDPERSWTLTEEGDEALFAAGCEGLA